MSKYAVLEISGRQYTIEPGQTIEVDKLNLDSGTLSVDKVLLMVDGDKVEVGNPYLKTKLDLEILGQAKGKKVRVAFYSPKANSRTVKGARRQVTSLKMAEAKEAKSESPSENKTPRKREVKK